MGESLIKKAISKSLHRIPDGRTWKIMEVCGTHTMSIGRMGIRPILGNKLKLISGPGCPVCVTSEGDLFRSLWLARQKDVIIATFGDMIRVPVGDENLMDLKAYGADVRVVYSPQDSLKIAMNNPGKQVVFLAVGFETTSPTIAATIKSAKMAGLKNFSIFPMMKLVPPALQFICAHPDLNIEGFLLPGHVSAIIGIEPYKFIVDKFSIPCAIGGFEDEDIVDSLLSLTEQIEKGKPQIYNSYSRVVKPDGNHVALQLLREVFHPGHAHWRGVGGLESSGLDLNKAYADFDVANRFDLPGGEPPEREDCLCGEVILGKILPGQCPQFGRGCTPQKPLGPCMVSSEGACAAYYKYGQ